MAFLELSDRRLHYRIDGKAGAPWLLFCNSLGTDLSMWDRQTQALSARFRILRYDRRGHGLSSTPPPPYGLDDLGADILALLDGLDIARTHFCGLSIGGLTGQWLGIHAGQRLDRLIVCATAARIGSAEGWAARCEAVRADGLAALTDATSERWFSPAFRAAEPSTVAEVMHAFTATSVDGYLGCCAALADADLRQDLGRIANPLLALSGAEDPVCPPADLEAIAGGVRNGRHLSLPGRHIVNIESSSAFNASLLAFLDSRP